MSESARNTDKDAGNGQAKRKRSTRKYATRFDPRRIPFNEEIASIIIEKIEEGLTLGQLQEIQGLPSWYTIRRWQDDNDDFAHRIARARVKAADAYETQVIINIGKILQEARSGMPNPDIVRAYQIANNDLKWLAGKRNRKEYGERVTEVEIPVIDESGPKRIVIEGGLPDAISEGGIEILGETPEGEQESGASRK